MAGAGRVADIIVVMKIEVVSPGIQWDVSKVKKMMMKEAAVAGADHQEEVLEA